MGILRTEWERTGARMFRGELVTLRPVSADDMRALYDACADADTWTESSSQPLWPQTFSAFEELYTKLAADEEAEFVIDVGGAVVGRCAVSDIDQQSRNASIGLTIATVHRAKGYGRDAVRLLLDYGFNKRNLHRMQLETLATNDRAQRAYLACGFVEEGRLREHAYARGQFVDVVVMSVLRSSGSPQVTAGTCAPWPTHPT